jgi:hypothetical protein
MTYEVKALLEPMAYEKLRQVIKTKTNFENVNKDNIELTKEAVNLVIEWLSEIYQIDRKELIMDSDGKDLDDLFNTTKVD